MRTAARPIPPMAPTVTRPTEPTARAAELGGAPGGRAPGLHRAPVARPAPPAAPRDHEPGQAPRHPTRGLRAWLRRRNPGPARV
jgi:hypothetical protein